MTQLAVAAKASGNSQQPSPRRRRRRWPWIVALVGTVVLIGFGVIMLSFVLREDPGAKPVGEAVDEFRQDETDPPVADPRRPAAGVYTATGEGHEALSFPPLSQDDGTTMPVTVRHEADTCWTFTVDYNEAHSQSWRYCPGSTDTLVERGGQTFQRWDLGATSLENTSTFVCDPAVLVFAPGVAVGTTWDQACEGTNTQVAGNTLSSGQYRLVAVELVTLEDGEVSTHHYRQSRAITGAQTGEETVDLWIDVDSRLPVRSERAIRIESASPVGAITYTENGAWQLTSREPKT